MGSNRGRERRRYRVRGIVREMKSASGCELGIRSARGRVSKRKRVGDRKHELKRASGREQG